MKERYNDFPCFTNYTPTLVGGAGGAPRAAATKNSFGANPSDVSSHHHHRQLQLWQRSWSWSRQLPCFKLISQNKHFFFFSFVIGEENTWKAFRDRDGEKGGALPLPNGRANQTGGVSSWERGTNIKITLCVCVCGDGRRRRREKTSIF